MENKSKINNLYASINNIPSNASVQRESVLDGELTGYPSIDKPWLKYYDEEAKKVELPKMTIYEYLFRNNLGNLKNTAIEYFGKNISFSSLFKNIDSVAESYYALGIKENDIVTICMPSTPETIYTIYALNKIGAIPNLIDPRYSEDMIKDLINEVDSKVLLTLDLCNSKIHNIADQTNLEKIISVSATNSAPLYVRALAKKSGVENYSDENWIKWEKFIEKKKEFSASNYKENKTSVIVHTGGTTGKPKGVVLSNDNINSITFQYKNGAIKLSNNQTFLDIIPPFAAYGICGSIHMPLTLGMKTILIPNFNPSKFDDLLLKHKPTHVLGVPSFWDNLTKSKKMKNKNLSFLQSPGCGGDSILESQEKSINNFFEDKKCSSKLIKGYGMSEVSSSACTCVDNCNELTSVGIPLIKTTISIFEPETTKELKYNTEGEICITGPGLMKEYYNNPELTSKTLKIHEDGICWLHTNDLGYMNENGVLYVTGRIKRMIVRYDGFKIYPSSIENVISECNGVEAVAVVKSTNEFGNIVKAYIVPSSENIDLKNLEVEILNKCKELLAERSVPAEFEFIEELPVTNLGKIDYKNLEDKSLVNEKIKKIVK